MGIESNVRDVIEGIQSGKILETFDRFYGNDVVMSENGANERVGFEACGHAASLRSSVSDRQGRSCVGAR